MPWVADGVDNADERTAAAALIACARWYPDVFSALLQKPWVGDSITADETVAISRLRRTGKYAPELADKMLQKSWAQDGITADEATVIQELYWIARHEDETFQQQVIDVAIRILDMPFLESVGSADALAVRSLSRLENNNTTDFLGIMSHPKISDGISDEEAKIVVLLYGTYTYSPESVDFLLRGTGVYLEERVIELPHSGETLLAIIRIRDQVTPNMDFLEHSVRTIEEFMGQPLPTNYIAWYFDDSIRATAGTNFGTHITSKLIYDVENGYLWYRAPFHNAHEVAHYYWRGNQRWISEGAQIYSVPSLKTPALKRQQSLPETLAPLPKQSLNWKAWMLNVAPMRPSVITRWERRCFWTCTTRWARKLSGRAFATCT